MNKNNANFTPAAPNFKTLVRMSFQGLTNFPYIEEDFDALTNYELLSKVVEYLNEVISNNNEQNTVITGLYNAYVSLQGYVNDYFDNLDVQDEINNKLDEMTESGALTTLIKNYVDPIYEAYEERIDNEIDTINAKVNSLSSGAPIPVSSTSEMTNTSKIYLNTTDGYWYYYNGTTWTRGGIYQSAEDSTTLKVLQNECETIRETSQNVFNMSELLKATGWSYVNGVYMGTAQQLVDTFTELSPLLSMKNVTDWILTLNIKTDANQSQTGPGLRFYFGRENTTPDIQAVSNTKTEWTYYTFKNPENNNIRYTSLYFGVGSGANNVWYIKDAQLLLNTSTDEEYAQHFSAKDIVARKDIDEINRQLETGVINPVKLVSKAMSGESLQIKLLGDSITCGYGGTGYNNTESGGGQYMYREMYQNIQGHCWANSLKAYVESKFPNVTIKNFGVTGAKSIDLITFFDITPLVEESDDVVIVTIGTNDRGDTNAKQVLYNNLVTLYNKIKNMNKKMIVIGNIPASVSNETTHNLNMHMEDVDMVVNSFAINNNVPYISVYKLFIEYCKYMNITIDSLLGDGLHPNDAGYDVMFYLISNELGFSTKRPDATW